MQSSLVGRGNDLRRARSLLVDPGLVFFVGPSGIGKSALCDSLAAEWRRRGGKVVAVHGTQGLQRVPFGALTLSLHVDLADSDSSTLARVGSLVADFVEPVLLVVDDTHLLDPESAAVISGLAKGADTTLVMAITSGEPQSADITSVWARWPDSRLDIEPLSRDEVGELLVALIDTSLDDAVVDRVAELTLGYPLYVTAIASELVAGAVRSDDVPGQIELSTSSDRLTRLMERRLSRLDREPRRLFDVVAFGESSPIDVVAGSARSSDLEHLEQAGLVKVSGGRVQVSHPLLGSVARDTLTSEGRRACARRLVDGLDEQDDPADVAAIVRKALAVGVTPPVEHLHTAAEVALGWGDYTGVAQITSVVLDDPKLKTVRARAARFIGEVPDIEPPGDLDEPSLTDYLSGTAQALAYTERRFSDAIDLLKGGMAGVVDEDNRSRLAMELMILSGLVGDLDSLLGAARAVASMDDPYTRLLALSATHLAEALTLTTASSDETYKEGRSLAATADGAEMLYEQLEMSHVLVDLAEARFEDAVASSAAFDDKTLVGSWLTIDAVLADAWLPIEEASHLADAAVAGLEQFDPLANLAQARFVADMRRAQLGQRPEHDDAIRDHEPGVAEIDRLMRQRVEAWLAWSDGDPAAGKRLVEVGRDAVAMGHRFWGLSSFIDATRLGNGPDVASDIEHLVITRGAGLAVLASRDARAATHDQLWASARMWWRAGAPVYAIEAACRGLDPMGPVDGLGIHLMMARGARPLVGDCQVIGNPLSERQTEIVARALEGATNDGIATALYLSRRTVENHLHRIYRALDIERGRDGLTDRYGWIFESQAATGS